MSSLVTASGATTSATLAAGSAFTVTSATNFLSASPASGDYVFVAVWLTRATATTAAQNANGTYGSVACGSVYLTCMENVSVPTTLSATSTTLFRSWNQTVTTNNNLPNIAIFGAPYQAGMSRQVTVTGYNSSGATAVLMVTAMAVQGIYTPPSNPATTWCKTIANGGVIDSTSGSGLAWASSGSAPSLTNFGSTKVNNSNLTSAIVDDIVNSATTGLIGLGSTGWAGGTAAPPSAFYTRYGAQNNLYIGIMNNFNAVTGFNYLYTFSDSNPCPPNLSAATTWTGPRLAIGQTITGTTIPRDTYITGFGYDPNFLGGGPAWVVYTSTTLPSSSTFILAGAEEPVLTVMLTNNTATTAVNTSVGNNTGTPNNGFTILDPQGSTMYVTTFGQSSGVVATSTNTALPTTGKMTVPTYGGNTLMSWTSKPSSTSLAGCTVASTPSDILAYQQILDNSGFTPTVYWDNTPVVVSGTATSGVNASKPLGIDTPSSVTATGATGFQTGTLVMTYGANRSGAGVVPLYAQLRTNGGTNFGFAAAFSFRPNKSALITTVSEVTEVETEPTVSARTLARNSELTDNYALPNGGAPRLLSGVDEISKTATSENASARGLNATSEPTSSLTTSGVSGRVLSLVSEITNSFTTVASKAVNGAKVIASVITATTTSASGRAISGISALSYAITTTSQKTYITAKTASQSLFSTTASTSGRVLSGISEVTEVLYSTVQSIYNHTAGTDYAVGGMFALGGYIPTLNTILGLGTVGQGALGYGNYSALTNWYNTTAVPLVAKGYVLAATVTEAITTENQRTLIRNVVSSVLEIPSSENQKAVSTSRTSEVSERPTTTSTRSVDHSYASSVAEILTVRGIKSIAKSVVSSVAEAPSGENSRQTIRNVISQVAIIATNTNAISKTLARTAAVMSHIATVATRSTAVKQVSEVAEKPTSKNSKSAGFQRSSEIAQKPTVTSVRSTVHSFASTVNALVSTSSQKSFRVVEVGTVAEHITTVAFAILLKIAQGFVATFTEYSKTEGFTEYPKLGSAADPAKTVFTTPSTKGTFQDDGVASYKEGQ